MKQVVLKSIRLYQKIFSPDQGFLGRVFLGIACRFAPTCSEYTHIAVSRYGIIKGLVLGLRRISKCHPWGGSGFDPVT
ncbi:MAG: hypothetical protein UV61_C0007G0022 [Candidatus Gottesmanbacteria bacterium GW2011_GWB1_43_11]|uniref:Putative membrane protein insertion efficiency factor n=1 Tax=Candidatus Gottesmanbacteria bacterium GW2011_GWB1_43_11 TaxID=1618446 RepID=A0A0G1CML5_9BACT|nr:MAG: hypothetical protein UV04_C0006G0022 [Candidatus Gottesmanbacteria bacterium GW2011_GWA2_42_16]KKS55853.1 MAG: hypothetical protein UV17_C0006G0010 [Candidatus Gottesmanbacteria bacterium GW2011_GWA1_42_26]KKS81254.1 MAG: hypothetical protein UV55_C0017G0011 [Candidatus Gottesmanbacteria bacterium GW2011_GWC1_43_10]KKS86764.1 MAG: hypothetical protein UV61_C0007G0022 [Candidatus Gottesmanbacteria bacterium GW2011_GWB1_43_11]OGG09844.1 MAG: membrane protein insertion efficiency factor Yi